MTASTVDRDQCSERADGVRCQMHARHGSYHAAERGGRWVEWHDGQHLGAPTVDRAVSAQAEMTIADHVAFFQVAGETPKDAAVKVRAFWAVAVADDAVAAALGRASSPTLTGMTVDCYRAACALTEATGGRS